MSFSCSGWGCCETQSKTEPTHHGICLLSECQIQNPVAAWFSLNTTFQLEPFFSTLFRKITSSRWNLRLQKFEEGRWGRRYFWIPPRLKCQCLQCQPTRLLAASRNVSENSYEKVASIRNSAFQKLKNLFFCTLQLDSWLWVRNPLGGSRSPTAEGSFGSANDGIVSPGSWNQLIK